MRIVIDLGKAARATRDGAQAAVNAVPVRVDRRAVLYMGVGAGITGASAALAPAAVCVGCAAAAGAFEGMTFYGITRAVSRKPRPSIEPQVVTA